MKQPRALLDEGDAQFLRRVEYSLVVVAPCRTGDVLDTGPCGAVDVIHERELQHVSRWDQS